MNDSTRVALALIVSTALALLAAGCGGSSHPAASAQVNGAVTTFSHCMRSNGVSRFPDPAAGGGIPKVALSQLGVSSSRFEAAQRACRHLLPNGGRGPTAAQVQEARATALKFSQCVRSHGVANFPDPDSTGRIPDPASVGIDQGSPRFEAANNACAKYRPPYMPSNAAYNAYAQTQG